MNGTIAFNLFPGGRGKALTMSYDDGTVHDRRLVEIFNRHAIRASFHLSSGLLGKSDKISPDEVAALYAGHEISAHSVNHPSLADLPDSLVAAEIVEDRRALEALAGYPVRGMSYPNGSYDQRLASLLPSLGIEYARIVRTTGGFGLPDNLLTWAGTCHHKQRLLELGKDFIERKARNASLMYVWGHSYEFQNDGNWDLIEQFCAQVGGRDDTWYATNIEIADYLNAARGLRFSVSGNVVHNPSATEVWFSVSGAVVQAPPGRTVSF
jgi:peptidoglycan-N-acetylglucosamine deacetylase